MPEQKAERSAADIPPHDLLFAYPEWSDLSRRLAASNTPAEKRALGRQKAQREQMHGPYGESLFELTEPCLACKMADVGPKHLRHRRVGWTSKRRRR